MAQYGLKADVYDVFLDTPHGKVMKLTGGKASPQDAMRIIKGLLGI